MKKSFIAGCAALLICSVTVAEEGSREVRAGDRAVSGEVRVAAAKIRQEKQAITVPVTLDLGGVRISGRDAALGAYVASVQFDPEQVTYVAVRGGEAKGFEKAPYATNREKANGAGLVKLAAVNTEVTDATGLLNVAQLQFVEKRPGGAESIAIRFDSVASTVVKEANGELSQHNLTIEEQR